MKNEKQAVPKADAPTDSKADAKANAAPKLDQGLSERRRVVRTLPVPEAQESEGDTDWALFQALSSDDSTAKK